MALISSTNIGVSTDGQIAISVNDGNTNLMSLLNPATARIFGAMMMALADQIEAPTPTEEPQ